MPVAMLHGVAYPMAKYIITVNKNADAPILPSALSAIYKPRRNRSKKTRKSA
jgi:hypothetical protein